ncbi:hypothetical protein AGMMS49974_06170 [Deltaproteobacteria bacterium]|nr:hypothetical protein AGMMS49925_04360 [Deltaproteobacteria bacterium]GHU95212.1 hypothetical protein AGMMS49974_06170 [Deltaproteobacteria bacterium]GHU98627.1 hypothetical protein AGMMS50248_05490 [Deltaproteobacteria bacterium]
MQRRGMAAKSARLRCPCGHDKKRGNKRADGLPGITADLKNGLRQTVLPG